MSSGKYCPGCGRFTLKILQTSEVCTKCDYSRSYECENKETIREYLARTKEENKE